MTLTARPPNVVKHTCKRSLDNMWSSSIAPGELCETQPSSIRLHDTRRHVVVKHRHSAVISDLTSPRTLLCCLPRCMQQRSLPPLAVPATGFRRAPLAARRQCWPQHMAAAKLTLLRPAMLTRTLPVLTAPALRHLHRAHAPCRCDARSPCDGSTRPRSAPCSRFSRSGFRLAARGAIILLTPALKGASKVRAVLALEPVKGMPRDARWLRHP